MQSDDVEIERRFLLESTPPGLADCPCDSVRQGYLALGDRTVRIRAMGVAHYLTVKGGDGLVRTEVECPLTRDQFDRLWPLTAGRRIAKTRYRLAWQGYTIEVDIFGGSLSGLCLAEVEFDSEAAALAFEPPGFLGREITGRREYSNASLAVHGLPAS